MQIKVLFFGILTEITGKNEMIVKDVKTSSGLIEKLQQEYPELADYHSMVSINQEVVRTDQALKDGDELALLPPFAGG